jgi:hypothetical protein
MRSVGMIGGRGALLAAKKRLEEGVVASGKEWRKVKLDQLENRFAPSSPSGSLSTSSPASSSSTHPSRRIDSDDDLQQAWRDLESRVRGRRPLSLEDRGGVSGRRNVRRTDEDVWLEEGLYEGNERAPPQGDIEDPSDIK